MKGFIEVLGKGAKRVLIDMNDIIAVSTSDGVATETIASPDHPLSILMRSNVELEVYGISAVSVMVAMQTFGRIDGWLPLP